MKLKLACAALLGAVSVPAGAVTVTVPPSGSSFAVADNTTASGGFSYTGIAQSVTVLDPNVTFGFYLRGESPSQILYSLYAGDGVFGAPLKQVVVNAPVTTSPISGLTIADFSDVTLVVGQRYTFRASLPNEGLPPSGAESAAGAYYAGGIDAYTAGRFYFTGSSLGEGQPALPTTDLAFVMTGVPEPATWAMLLLGFGAVGAAMRRRGGEGRPAPA